MLPAVTVSSRPDCTHLTCTRLELRAVDADFRILLENLSKNKGCGLQKQDRFFHLFIDAASMDSNTAAVWTLLVVPRDLSQPGHGLGNLRNASNTWYCPNIGFDLFCRIDGGCRYDFACW